MTFIPTRKKNKEYRSREFLTLEEVEALLEVAQSGRKFQARNYALVLIMFRHGLRAQEASNLRWDAILWGERKISINRCKNGLDGVHPLKDDELKVLQELKAQSESQFIFSSERGKQLTAPAIAQVINRLGDAANLGFKVHPHQLRHACGYYMANKGYTTRDIQAYLGHRNIQNTEKYTALSSARFNDIWD